MFYFCLLFNDPVECVWILFKCVFIYLALFKKIIRGEFHLLFLVSFRSKDN